MKSVEVSLPAIRCCRDCKEEKTLDLFIKSKAFSSGIDTLCVDCNRKRVKDWRKRNPEKRAAQMKKEPSDTYNKRKHLKRAFGMTLETYNDLFNLQEGCCAICGIHQSNTYRSLCVDHNHSTGKIRQLLCSQCNSVIGFAKENIDILKNAITYLQRNNNDE